MKHVLSSLIGVILMVTMLVSMMFIPTSPASTAPVEEPQGCVLSIAGVKVCGTLLDQPLSGLIEVTVPGPTVTLPPVTITPPTVTIRPDPIRLTETIRPAPVRITETVTLPALPQPTVTVTDRVPNQTVTVNPQPQPQATVTETVRPNGDPVPTATETVTVTPEPEVVEVTRQSEPESGTVEPSNEDTPFFTPDINFGDDNVTAGEAGVGLLGALLILALILAGMSYGFRRGMKTESREEATFLRSMLDRNKTS